VANGWNY